MDGLEVPPLKAVSDKQLAYARAVRASAVHGFLSVMLARGAKLPRSSVEEQMPMLAGWVQSHLRAETERRYWLTRSPEVPRQTPAACTASEACDRRGALPSWG
ncbi:MAG: hypothetical protein EOO71_24545 [Myxococcaceae bacterium]|nr:MAG: hypothetical protein EOO71_24545 [Myxococcaceae bacterium]